MMTSNVAEYLEFKKDITHSSFAEAYDELPFWSAPFGMLLFKNIPLKPGMVVLDMGSGTGFPSIELAERLGDFAQVYCLDPWQSALEQLDRKKKFRDLKNVHVTCGDATQAPFQAQTFDIVVSNLGINNFENSGKVFSECKRVLKENGLLVITTNLVGHMQEFYDVYRDTLQELKLSHYVEPLLKHVNHRATIEGTGSNIQKAGFAMKRVFSDSFTMRFADGSAFLRHSFIKIGFLPSWKAIVDSSDLYRVFERLERKLNELAAKKEGLTLTIPMAYMEAQKSD